MTGSTSKRKGYAGENHCAKTINGWNGPGQCPVRARRGDGTIGEDVYVHVGAGEFRFEAKFHKRDIVTVRKWFEGTDAIYFRTNYKEPWFAVKPDVLRDIIAEAYRAGQKSITTEFKESSCDKH